VPGYLYRPLHAIGMDNVNGKFLWEALPGNVYGMGQLDGFRFHPPLNPAATALAAGTIRPQETRSTFVRAYAQGDATLFFYSKSGQAVHMTYLPVPTAANTAQTLRLLRPLPIPAGDAPVFQGTTFWQQETVMAGAVTAVLPTRRLWILGVLYAPTRLPELTTAIPPALQAASGEDMDFVAEVLSQRQFIYTRFANPMSNGQPQADPLPPPPPVSLFSSADPGAVLRPRDFYSVQQLRVDTDGDGLYDDEELAGTVENPYDLDNNNDGLPNAYGQPRHSGSQAVLIQRLETANRGELTDAAGQTPDFCVLSNPGATVMNMTGWQLRIPGDAAAVYTFPAASPGGISSTLTPGGELTLLLGGTGADARHRTGFSMPEDALLALYRPNPGIPGAWLLVDMAARTYSAPVINEVMAKDILPNPDWVEIYNPTATQVNLSGWKLVVPGLPAYTFQAIPALGDNWHLLPAGGYMVIYCDALSEGTQGRHHAPFTLANDVRTTVRLVRNTPLSTVADAYDEATARYGVPVEGRTFGRYLNTMRSPGQSALATGYLAQATPGAANGSEGYEGICAPPVLTVRLGTQAAPGAPVPPGLQTRQAADATVCTATTAQAGTVVHYTLNGAVPDCLSAVPTGGYLALPPQPAGAPRKPGYTVRATAFRDGWLPSKTVTQTWLIKEDVVGTAADGSDAQKRPPNYPARSLPQNNVLSYPDLPNGAAVPYHMTPSEIARAGARSEMMTGLSAIPSVVITCPEPDMFEPDTGGIMTCSTLQAPFLKAPWPVPVSALDPRGQGWERACTMEYLDPNMPPTQLVPRVDCGIRVAGYTTVGWERAAKRSWALLFKSQYGPSKFAPNFPLFPGDAGTVKYNTLSLRNPSGDSWGEKDFGDRCTFAKEPWARDTFAAMGPNHLALKSRLVHLYLNGLYWGVYSLSERAEQDTLATRVAGGNWQVWANGGDRANLIDGGAAANTWWDGFFVKVFALRAAVQASPLDPTLVTQRYNALAGDMDMANFADYVILNDFMSNYDVLNNNGRMYRKDTNSGPHRFLRWTPWDTDFGMNDNGPYFFEWQSHFLRPVSGAATSAMADSLQTSATLYKVLSLTADWRVLYTQQVQRHLFTTYPNNEGVLSLAQATARFNPLADLFGPARLVEFGRWGRKHSLEADTPSLGDGYRAGNRTYVTGTFMPLRPATVLPQMRSFGLYPPIDAPVVTQVITIPDGPHPRLAPPVLAPDTRYVIRYTTDGSDPVNVPFPPPASGLQNVIGATSGVLFTTADLPLTQGFLRVLGNTYTPVSGPAPPGGLYDGVAAILASSAPVELSIVPPP
jgi:hypothetical protein